MAVAAETLSVELRLAAPLADAALQSSLFRHVGASAKGSFLVRFAALRKGGARSLLGWLEEHAVGVAEVLEVCARGSVTALGVLDGLPLELDGDPLVLPESPWREDLVYAVGGDCYVLRTKVLEQLFAEGDAVRDIRGPGASTWREWRCARASQGRLAEDPFGVGEHLGLFVRREDAPALEGATLEPWGWSPFLASPERTVRPVVLGPRVASKLRGFDAKIVAPVLEVSDWQVAIAHALVERAGS